MAPIETPRRRRGVIAACIHTVLHLVGLMVLAWLIVALGFGIYRMHHSQNTTEIHLVTLVRTTHDFLPHNSWIEYQRQQAKQSIGNFWILQKKRITGVEPLHPLTENVRFHALSSKAHHLGRLLNHITELIFCKMVFLLHAAPLFLLMIGLGGIDGLVQRDIRKFQAAQESALFFHAITQRFSFCFFLLCLRM